MPNATVSQGTSRVDLKSLPSGFVVLRTLSYGEVLERRDNATKMVLEQERNRSRRSSQDDDLQKIQIDVVQSWTRWFEFKTMIVEHNLEDANGKPLNFMNQMTMQVLDPKVGQEIEREIDKLIGDDDEESLEDFTKRATASSTEETEIITSPEN